MKKTFAFVWCLVLLIALFSGCFSQHYAENITFTAVIEEVRDGSILVSTADDVGFSMASVSIGGLETDFDLSAGQTVRLTILPRIQESYPVQATAISIELVDEAAAETAPTRAPENPPENTAPGAEDNGAEAAPEYKTENVPYSAYYYRIGAISEEAWSYFEANCDNSDKMADDGSRHLPALRFDTAAAMTDFIYGVQEKFQMKDALFGSAAFVAMLGQTGAIFEKDVLVAVLVRDSSGADSHKVKSVTKTNGTVTARVIYEEQDVVVPDDWVILIEIPKTSLADCTYTDAYIHVAD